LVVVGTHGLLYALPQGIAVNMAPACMTALWLT